MAIILRYSFLPLNQLAHLRVSRPFSYVEVIALISDYHG